MIGILLINLGTPEAPTAAGVRRYLREFLSDPLVIDIHPLARWVLVNLVIAPFRSPKSAAAYRKIWTPQGSPLKVHTQALAEAVERKLGAEFKVRMAMRYGNPTIQTGLEELATAGAKEIRVLPLYPQYALSSTASSIQAVEEAVRKLGIKIPVQILDSFYNHPAYIRSFAAVGRPVLQALKPDHVLFSFHGLPERHLRKLDPLGMHCFKRPDCCEEIKPANRNCYRAQAYFTTRLLARELGLDAQGYTVCFQSRLGRTPWIQPYTDYLLEELPRGGAKKIAVFCPAFVADCLETLEEIQIRGRELFLSRGGVELTLIPSLNAHPIWVEGVAEMLKSGGG